MTITNEGIERRNKELGLSKLIKNSKPIKNIKKQHCFEVEVKQKGKNLVKTIACHQITPLD
jgi:hypothetical protein